MCLLFFSAVMIPEVKAGDEIDVIKETETGTGIKTITRKPDPVIVTGDNLSGVTGLNPTRLGLYAVEDNKLIPIPFQVDQRDEEGNFFLTEMGGEVQDLSHLFDDNDEVVFMAKDLGDRCFPDQYPTGWKQGIEIEVVDPVNESRGWCYLFAFDRDPERSKQAYTRYLLTRGEKDGVDTNVYVMEFPPVEQERECQML